MCLLQQIFLSRTFFWFKVKTLSSPESDILWNLYFCVEFLYNQKKYKTALTLRDKHRNWHSWGPHCSGDKSLLLLSTLWEMKNVWLIHIAANPLFLLTSHLSPHLPPRLCRWSHGAQILTVQAVNIWQGLLCMRIWLLLWVQQQQDHSLHHTLLIWLLGLSL